MNGRHEDMQFSYFLLHRQSRKIAADPEVVRFHCQQPFEILEVSVLGK